MSLIFDDLNVGGQLKVGIGIVPAVGEGPTKVNGSAYIEGPIVMGSATAFPWPYGCLNVGPLVNEDNLVPPVVPGALAVFPGGGGGNSSIFILCVWTVCTDGQC